MVGSVIRASCIFLFILFVAGCAVNPVTGKNELSLISESEELAIGREHYVPSQQSQGGTYTADPALTEYVSEVGQRVAAVSDRDLPYEFVVLNNSVPNAWALPGGKIAINRGLLTELGSEAELAAVLGHEVVHAAARHSASQMSRGMLLQGALLATAIGVADNDYSNYIVGGAQIGAQLISQTYSRDAELEADYYGTHYMKHADYNPEAAVSLQETFVRLSEGRNPGWLEGLFASHPPSQERVQANKETAAALGTTGELGKERFRNKLSYLESKQPAYDAFDQAMTLAGQNEFSPALSRIDKAIEIEPNDARFYGLRGDILLAQDDFEAATREFDKALAIDDNYYQYYLGRGIAKSKLGLVREARADLERSNQLLPTAIANNTLGEMSLTAGNRLQAKQYFQTAMNASGSIGQAAQASFVKLDVSDNPGRYIASRPELASDGTLVAILRNNTNLPLEDVRIEFGAQVNGRPVRRLVEIDRLGPGQEGTVASGWRFSESDVVAEAYTRIVKAAAN